MTTRADGEHRDPLASHALAPRKEPGVDVITWTQLPKYASEAPRVGAF
jgi:hypothetical protein